MNIEDSVALSHSLYLGRDYHDRCQRDAIVKSARPSDEGGSNHELHSEDRFMMEWKAGVEGL